MKKIIDWLVYSSENTENMSLTIKGILSSVLPLGLLLANQLGLTLDPEQVDAFVLSALTVFTTSVALFGLIRKIVNTYKGKEVVTFVKAAKPKKTTKK